MTPKLWCIHTLNIGDALGEITLVVCADVIFQNVGAFINFMKKEVGGSVAGAFEISETVGENVF